ncbi:2-oxo-4-hydroxy-4-carboxy-5-ureidoimidazoline decarboxylase [Nocardia brasiliensis]|uniref:2-oxo-4-hydroxy-4-carboxy-5-ureidoimidazoline decarboxylase n=1 Tax=Nocardia brasiliensis TaxID=37326 RepID=UPI001893BC3B|nr:2-oxo-4-hydroxy-4-carboxy-5-ureidoimidazoline decarboxylase [Nocardia brasiliensis]MBF6128275.1 2-oxo-4-hydroxy-4-carboxy-5-ureidoimidazoline decarboxylase [Nocardia brasiliensis]
MTDDADGLDRFDAMPQDAAVEALLACCSSPQWARALAAGRPYSSVGAVLDTADTVLAGLPEAEIDRALAGHPRIGERPHSAASAREQAGVAGAPDEVHAALAAGNRAYEQRFGYRYLVCASGRTGSELLALLQDRLHNDFETERRVMRTELAKINRLRLRALLTAAA